MGYFVRVEPNVNIYVEDVNPTGDKTILFIHGWPLNHHLFEYQFYHLPQLGYRCIAIDIRGFGNSDKPFKGYSYDRLADDIRCIIEILHLKNITLAGHSMGGAIAIRYMGRHHGYGISKLVLIDAAAPVGFSVETANKLIDQTYQDRPNMLKGVTDIFFFQYISVPFSDWFFQMGLQAAGWSTASTVASLRDENVSTDLLHITVPTLIVHGIHDQVIPFAQAQEVQRSIAHTQLVPFEYSGHGPVWEERDKFNRVLTEFIG
ncbi:Arylesterase [compost metagenome]